MGGNFGRALGTSIPQALTNITSMQNLAIREEENKRAIETHGQNIRINEQVMQENTIKLKKAEMEQAEAEKLHKIQTTPQPTDALWNTPYMSQFAPKTTAKFMEDFNKSPYVTPQYGTDGKTTTHYTSTPQLQMKYAVDNQWKLAGHLNEGIAEIGENINLATQAMQAETKPEKQQQLKIQIDRLTTARTMLQQQSGGLQAELAKLEAQKEAKETEMTGNVVRDKDSETGWAYTDKQGNIIARNAPMPSVYKPEKAGGEGKEYKETVLMEFLMGKGLAKDYKEAWRMVKSLSGKSREDFMSETWMKAYTATEDETQADEVMKKAGDVWDKAHGAEGGKASKGKTMGNLWQEVSKQGSSSKGKAYLMKTYKYSDAQATDIIKQGIASGDIK